MNVFLLLMVVLVVAYGMEIDFTLSTTKQKKIYGKCRDDLSKCRKKASRSSKPTKHWARLLACQLDFQECVSVIAPSILDGLK
ncbi:hypothetical protein ScPMuIL_002594 [Solemya velum]